MSPRGPNSWQNGWAWGIRPASPVRPSDDEIDMIMQLAQCACGEEAEDMRNICKREAALGDIDDECQYAPDQDPTARNSRRSCPARDTADPGSFTFA